FLLSLGVTVQSMSQTGPGEFSNPLSAPGPTRTSRLKLDPVLNSTACVEKIDDSQNAFFVSNAHHNPVYRLIGAGWQGYMTRGVRIVGALVPTPNIAAQVGSIDQTDSAMASTASSPAGAPPAGPRKPRGTPARTVSGSCPSP